MTNYRLIALSNLTFQWTRDLSEFAVVYDLPNCVFRAQIRDKPSDEFAIYEFVSANGAYDLPNVAGRCIYNAATKLLRLAGPEADIRKLVGRKYLDLRIELPTNERRGILAADIRFDQGVTRTASDASSTGVGYFGDTVIVVGEVDPSPVPLQLAISAATAAATIAIDDYVATVLTRRVDGDGLITGGGPLSAGDIDLTVAIATPEDVSEGLRNDVAVTPKSMAGSATVPIGAALAGNPGIAIDSADGIGVIDLPLDERALVIGTGTDDQGYVDTVGRRLVYPTLQGETIIGERVETDAIDTSSSGVIVESPAGPALFDLPKSTRALVIGTGTDDQGYVDTQNRSLFYPTLAADEVGAPVIDADYIDFGSGLAVDSYDGNAIVDLPASDRALVFGAGGEDHGHIDTTTRTLHYDNIAVEESISGHDVTAFDVNVSGGNAIETPEATHELTGKLIIGDSLTGATIEEYDPATQTKTIFYKQRIELPRPISVRTEFGPTLVRDHLSNPEYQVAGRLHVGVATLARTGSRYWAAWWCHNHLASEASGNYIAIAYSDDGRVTWTELGVLAYTSAAIEYKIIDPMFWTNPDNGELWIIVNVSRRQDNDGTVMTPGDALSDGIMGGWALICSNPTALAAQTVWSRPFRLGYIGDPRRPTRIAGEWWLPIDLWRALATSPPIYPDHTGCWLHRFIPHERRVEPIVRLPPNVGSTYSGFFETEVIELRDGRLMATLRTGTGTDRSFSTDSGKTWSAWATWSADISSNSASSRIWLGRTATGRMMLIYNSEPTRQILTVALSDDDGETFPYLVVANPGVPGASYPIAVVNGDLISIVWDHGRTSTRQIYVSDLSEAAIVAGTAVPTLHIVSQP